MSSTSYFSTTTVRTDYTRKQHGAPRYLFPTLHLPLPLCTGHEPGRALPLRQNWEVAVGALRHPFIGALSRPGRSAKKGVQPPPHVSRWRHKGRRRYIHRMLPYGVVAAPENQREGERERERERVNSGPTCRDGVAKGADDDTSIACSRTSSRAGKVER